MRATVARLERGSNASPASTEAAYATVPFGERAIDAALPGGGLARGALHEAMGAGPETEHAASAGRFLAGVVARAMPPAGQPPTGQPATRQPATRQPATGQPATGQPAGWAIWIADEPPFLPALLECGVDATRLLLVRARGAEVLQAMEDALQSGAMTAVVGELDANFSLTASRRLQLAAEASGALALLLRRTRKFDDPGLGNVSAATTRWRIGSVPSAAPLASRPGLRGLGPARWRVELLRSRRGGTGSWLVEASGAQGRLRLVADVLDRPVAPPWPDPAQIDRRQVDRRRIDRSGADRSRIDRNGIDYRRAS